MRAGPHLQSEPSPELLEVYYDALRKQEWIRPRRFGTRVPFVGRFSPEEHWPFDVAAYLRESLRIDELRSHARTWEDFFRALARRLEEVGVIVLKARNVAPSGRPLDPEEFKGFALADPIAPVIFVNIGGSVASNTFTLAHEVAHLAIGGSGLDDDPFTYIRQAPVETFCNKVAAEFLIPVNEFYEAWREVFDDELHHKVQRLAAYFKVSALSVAIRARELELISGEELDELRAKLAKRIQQKKKGPGGSSDRTLESRNGRLFTQAVVDASRAGEVTYSEAAALLGVSLKTFLGYLDRQEKARQKKTSVFREAER